MRIGKNIWVAIAAASLVLAASCGGSGDGGEKSPQAVSDPADSGSGANPGDSTGACTDTSVINSAKAKCVSQATPVDGPFGEGEAALYCDCLYGRWASKLNCTDLASRDFQPVNEPDKCFCMEQQRPYCDSTAGSGQTVQCSSEGRSFDVVYLLTRDGAGAADVQCNGSAGGQLVSNEVHYEGGTDASLLAQCVLTNFPGSGDKTTLERIETDLPQAVEDPNTVVHGGVSVTTRRADGSEVSFTMGDADSTRNLPGECNDSTGN